MVELCSEQIAAYIPAGGDTVGSLCTTLYIPGLNLCLASRSKSSGAAATFDSHSWVNNSWAQLGDASSHQITEGVDDSHTMLSISSLEVDQ